MNRINITIVSFEYVERAICEGNKGSEFEILLRNMHTYSISLVLFYFVAVCQNKNTHVYCDLFFNQMQNSYDIKAIR